MRCPEYSLQFEHLSLQPTIKQEYIIETSGKNVSIWKTEDWAQLQKLEKTNVSAVYRNKLDFTCLLLTGTRQIKVTKYNYFFHKEAMLLSYSIIQHWMYVFFTCTGKMMPKIELLCFLIFLKDTPRNLRLILMPAKDFLRRQLKCPTDTGMCNLFLVKLLKHWYEYLVDK